MIILIGASSGIGLELIKDLIKYDNILATYNKKKINVKINNKKNSLIVKRVKLSISHLKTVRVFDKLRLINILMSFKF